MKKFILFFVVLLFGCSSHTESDLFKSLEISSVSDTLNNLSEVYQISSDFNGTTVINDSTYEMWELGEDISVLSNAEQSVVSYRKENIEIEEIEMLLKDYSIGSTDKLDEVLDRDEKTLDGDNYIDIFLQPDNFIGSNDEVVVIVQRSFDVPKLKEYYKVFTVTVYYDKTLAEVAKSELLK